VNDERRNGRYFVSIRQLLFGFNNSDDFTTSTTSTHAHAQLPKSWLRSRTATITRLQYVLQLFKKFTQRNTRT